MTFGRAERVSAYVLIERARHEPGQKWCIVQTDDEDGSVSTVEGFFDDEISAVAESQRQKSESRRHFDDVGEKGWTYKVVPYFDRKEPS